MILLGLFWQLFESFIISFIFLTKFYATFSLDYYWKSDLTFIVQQMLEKVEKSWISFENCNFWKKNHTKSHCKFTGFSFTVIVMACFSNLYLITIFFVKYQCSLLVFHHLTTFLLTSWNLLVILLKDANFSSRNRANPGKVSMDLNSLEKTLNSILNTLPRTLAPLEAIRISRKCF